MLNIDDGNKIHEIFRINKINNIYIHIDLIDIL